MTARALLPIVLAACSFDGNIPAADGVPGVVDAPLDDPDADPNVPDADPDQPDAAAAADARVDAATGTGCPPGYGFLIGAPITSQYRFEATQRAWIDAEHDCEDDAAGGFEATHLAVLDDTIERGALIGGLTGLENLNDQWIGLTDLFSEPTFLYVTAQPTVFVGAPTGDADNQDCVRLKNTGVHDIRGCNETNRFVCECDGIPADPARFPNPPDGNP
jgi:hypothetical protein